MEANDFVAKLKADGSENDEQDLEKVHQEYKKILLKLSSKDKGSFAVNVLCILCRNVDKVPTWSANISSKDLVTFSLECVRETRLLGPPEQAKVLACVYHLHKYIVRQSISIPPELVLKLSYSSFDFGSKYLLAQYVKTYWNMLADRIAYIEKLKAKKVDVIKLIPRLTEDITKTIKMYDTVQFCDNVLVFVIKKLYYISNELNASILNGAYKTLFDVLGSKSDIKNFKKLPERDALNLYLKFNDIFYVIIENSTKISFKDSVLYTAVSVCICFLGHQSDIYHCLQTFYLNSFCNILTERASLNFTESILSNVIASCDMTEKLGYDKAMTATYPYISQMLRLFVEYMVTESAKKRWSEHFNLETQEKCLILITLLMKKLRKSEQIVKCDNCKIRTGLHDALRLSLCVRHLVSVSLAQNMDITKNLPIYYNILGEQHNILNALHNMGCYNHRKCLTKAQTDIHNTAILLNKSSSFEFSIKVFDLYLKHEIRNYKTGDDLKNISRGFYNKAICEMNFELYEDGLQSAYLSFLFAQPEALNFEKHISIVIDIKSKLLKHISEEDNEEMDNKDHWQMITVLDACRKAIESDFYGNLKPLFSNQKFSKLLKQEFSVYAKLWPSILPIAGVWASLDSILEKEHIEWLQLEKEQDVLWTLYEVILETPTVVRTIHSEYFTKIVKKLHQKLQPKDAKEILVYSTLSFLKCEFDIAEASEHYGWKITDMNPNPEQTCITRSIPQEHKALLVAIKAVEMLTLHLKELKKLPPSPYLRHWLRHSQVCVSLLRHLARPAHALHLAHICCSLAHSTGDSEIFVQSAGTILVLASTRHPALRQLESEAGARANELLRRPHSLETAVVFLCDNAMYRKAIGCVHSATQLVQVAQARILTAIKEYPNLNLEFAIGRLLEATASLRTDSAGLLAAVTAVQRHYLAVSNTATNWTARRLFSLNVKFHISRSSLLSVQRCRALLLWRRARNAAACALSVCSAASLAGLLAGTVCSHRGDDAQTTIDSRLKHILGLQPTNETQPQINNKTQTFTTPSASLVEPMRDSQMFKKNQTSPSMPCVTVPGFKMPDFMTHDARCQCYACQTPVCFILACQTAGLEASLYFRAKEFDIARNYFAGVLEMFGFVETKMKQALKVYKDMRFDDFVVETVEKMYRNDFERAQIEILIEAAFYELAMKNYEKADDFIVRIHEIMQEMPEQDSYVKNEVMNLICTSARLRKLLKKPVDDETGLETELENLKLSPTAGGSIEPPKTPDLKPDKPPKVVQSPVKVDAEEIPTKRKVIKLNLDDEPSDEKPTSTRPKRAQFKIPVPITSRPVPENITPGPSRHKPKLLVTQPSEDTKSNITLEITTPKSVNATAFFTPREIDTPSNEQFFTPMTSFKTCPKKSLRDKIVKSLEQEFATNIAQKDKENADSKAQKAVAIAQKDKENADSKAQKAVAIAQKDKENADSKAQKAVAIAQKDKENADSKAQKAVAIAQKDKENADSKAQKAVAIAQKDKENADSKAQKAVPIAQKDKENADLKAQKAVPIAQKDKENADLKAQKGASIAQKDKENADLKAQKAAPIAQKDKENADSKAQKADTTKKNQLKLPTRSKSAKVESGPSRCLKEKRTLRRATSPGKLEEKTSPQNRRRQLRQPVNFSLDDKK